MLWRSEGSIVLKTARRRWRPDPYWNDNRLKMGYITAKIIFWLGLGTLAYVYVGYPLLVYFVSRVFPKTTARGESNQPSPFLLRHLTRKPRFAKNLKIRSPSPTRPISSKYSWPRTVRPT